MIDKLELNHLRTLSALYQFGSISATAEHLSVSQQAISLQLKKIRAILDDQLFVRTGHGMIPTPYAKDIEQHIEKILIQINSIPQAKTFSPQDIERTLVICATDYTQEVIVTGLIEELRLHSPKVKVIVTNIEHANLTKKIHQGTIDLVLTTSAYAPEGLISTPLFTEKYLCVTANKAIKSTHDLSLEQLTKYDFIIVSPGIGSFIGSADTWFEQQGFPRQVTVSVPSFHMAKNTLKHSNMVGFIPSRLLPDDELFELPLEKYPPGYQVVAAYHPNAQHDPLISWLLDRIQKKFTH